MSKEIPLKAVFYASETGHEPVREWLKSLLKDEKKKIGEDIKTAQLGWPIGMPVARKLEKDIWEIRTDLKNSISRVLITIIENNMVLLHGFIKKTRKTPKKDLGLASKRLQMFGGK